MATSTLKDYEGNQFEVAQLVNLANQISQKFDYANSTGGVFATEKQSIGFDYPELLNVFGQDAKINVFNQVSLDIARTLLSKGISDLSLLEGAKKVIPENTRGGVNYLIPDKPGLEKLPLDAQGNRVLAGLQQDGVRLGETATGAGKTVYYLDLSSGTPSIKTKAIETSDKDTALFVVSMALMAVPGAGTAIGSALGATGTTATALGNAVINTATQVAAGVPIDKAIVNSAATYGVSQYIPNLTGNPYVDNAVRSVATATLTGGDVQNALANSLIATGATQELGKVSITGDRTIDSGIVSGLTSSLQAKVTGGDPGASFVQGFTRGASTAISQDEARAQRAASGAGFLGEYDDLSGAGPADYVMGERDPALVQAGLFDSARGVVQSALANVSKSWLAAGQQIGIAPQTLQRAIDYLSVIEQGGEALIPEDVKAQQQAFINKIYSVASDPNSTNTEKARAIIEATLENPLGSFTLVSKEVIQELPQLLIPGRVPAMLGNFVLNIAESAGNQALQKIDELRQANPNMTNEQLIAAARNDAGVAGAVTAAMSLLPGMNTRVLQPAIQSFNEFLESGLTTYLLTGDRSKALGDAILGGVIGGKTTTALQTGEQVANAAQQTLPSLGTITVSSTRLPSDQATVTPGEPLAITPSVVDRAGTPSVIPAPNQSVIVVTTDPANNTALVIDNTGQTKIVSATDAGTGAPVTQGQTLTITPDNRLTSSTTPVTPGGTPTGGLSALDIQNLQASSQFGQGAQTGFVQPTGGTQPTGGVLVTTGGQPTVQPTGGTGPVIGGTQPVTGGTGVRPEVSPDILAQQARIDAEQDIANRTYKGQVYRTAAEADAARLADTAPTTRPTTTTYSANVAATPEIARELLALSGFANVSDATIRILLAGNPTIGELGQEILILKEMRSQSQAARPGVSTEPAPATTGGTPTVTTGQQTGPTIVTGATQQTQPVTTPTVTPTVTPTTTTGVTPSTTESINLTFNPGRVNVDTLEDTVSAVDTVGTVDTVRGIDTVPAGVDTSQTFDTVEDTVPQDTTPTYGDDEDIIRFLGLDQEPTPTETPPAEDTIGGGIGGGTADVAQEEQLAIAPKAVYTPKPGTRVVDTGTSVLPTRVQLSEGMGDDVEGTGEEEQQPVWNVRSLKLRRALGI